MADTYNELGDKNRAVDLANEVLKRVRNSVATPSVQPADWSKSLTREEVREKLYAERIFEFAGEPNMYDMARLKGVDYLKMTLAKHNNHEITRASANLYQSTSNNKLDRLYNEANGVDLSADFLKPELRRLPPARTATGSINTLCQSDHRHEESPSPHRVSS